MSSNKFPERFVVKVEITGITSHISNGVICNHENHSLGGNRFSFVTSGYTPKDGEIVEIRKKRGLFKSKWVLITAHSDLEHALDFFDL